MKYKDASPKEKECENKRKNVRQSNASKEKKKESGLRKGT